MYAYAHHSALEVTSRSSLFCVPLNGDNDPTQLSSFSTVGSTAFVDRIVANANASEPTLAFHRSNLRMLRVIGVELVPAVEVAHGILSPQAISALRETWPWWCDAERFANVIATQGNVCDILE